MTFLGFKAQVRVKPSRTETTLLHLNGGGWLSGLPRKREVWMVHSMAIHQLGLCTEASSCRFSRGLTLGYCSLLMLWSCVGHVFMKHQPCTRLSSRCWRFRGKEWSLPPWQAWTSGKHRRKGKTYKSEGPNREENKQGVVRWRWEQSPFKGRWISPVREEEEVNLFRLQDRK